MSVRQCGVLEHCMRTEDWGGRHSEGQTQNNANKLINQTLTPNLNSRLRLQKMPLFVIDKDILWFTTHRVHRTFSVSSSDTRYYL